VREKNEIKNVNKEDFYLNLIINLDKKGIKLNRYNKLVSYLPKLPQYGYIHFIIEFYEVYNIILKNNTNFSIKFGINNIEDFLNKRVDNLFNKNILDIIRKLSVETFNEAAEKLFKLLYSKSAKTINNNFIYIPVLILENLIKEKSSVKLITACINLLFQYEQEVKYFLFYLLFLEERKTSYIFFKTNN
jgi:hypothetical protein